MDNKNDKVALDDELLDKVSGGILTEGVQLPDFHIDIQAPPYVYDGITQTLPRPVRLPDQFHS